jgi:hypothetical protein
MVVSCAVSYDTRMHGGLIEGKIFQPAKCVSKVIM